MTSSAITFPLFIKQPDNNSIYNTGTPISCETRLAMGIRFLAGLHIPDLAYIYAVSLS
jgi:hypothetical protein